MWKSAVEENEKNMKKISLHECILSDLCWFHDFIYIFLSINRLFWHKNIDRNWETLALLTFDCGTIFVGIFSSCFIILLCSLFVCLFMNQYFIHLHKVFCNFASSLMPFSSLIYSLFRLDFEISRFSLSKQTCFMLCELWRRKNISMSIGIDVFERWWTMTWVCETISNEILQFSWKYRKMGKISVMTRWEIMKH